MAEIVLHSIPQPSISICANIGSGRAWISIAPQADDAVSVHAMIRSYDASRDTLLSIPDGGTFSREDLDWELDLHIPPILSKQTSAHWFGSYLAGNVLLQPIDQKESFVSPLEGLRDLAESLPGDGTLLHCESGSMLAIESIGETLIVRPAGMNLESLAAMDAASRSRVLAFRDDAHVFLSGPDVTPGAIGQLNRSRLHGFEPISMQHLLAHADIEPATMQQIRGRECSYALLVGAAAALAGNRHAFSAVR